MGCTNTIEEGTSKSDQSNPEQLEVYAELCSRWGYGDKKDQVLALIKELNKKGFDIKFTFDPRPGGQGEFFVYLVKKEGKTIVFSNDPSHKCVIGEEITVQNLHEIVSKIQSVK